PVSPALGRIPTVQAHRSQPREERRFVQAGPVGNKLTANGKRIEVRTLLLLQLIAAGTCLVEVRECPNSRQLHRGRLVAVCALNQLAYNITLLLASGHDAPFSAWTQLPPLTFTLPDSFRRFRKTSACPVPARFWPAACWSSSERSLPTSRPSPAW